MEALPEISDARLFARYAGGSLALWRGLVGCRIRHKASGAGIVTNVDEESRKLIYVSIRFDNAKIPTKKFHSDVFSRWKDITELDLPVGRKELATALDELRSEERRERARNETEREGKQEFRRLKIEYKADIYSIESPSSPLFAILRGMKSGARLTNDDIVWLESNRVYGPLALHYESEYERTGCPWDCVKASRNWRKCSLAEKSLDLTDQALGKAVEYGPRLKGALLTTRGAAFRVLSKLPQAELSAKEALKYDPDSFYPYNLLGGIYSDMGRPREAEKFFGLAREHGAKGFDDDDMHDEA